MLLWHLTVAAASVQAEPIIHLFLEASALPAGPLHILSPNQQETGDSVRPRCRAKQRLRERFFSSDLQHAPRDDFQLVSPPDRFISAFFAEHSTTPSSVTEKTQRCLTPKRQGHHNTLDVTACSKGAPPGPGAGVTCPTCSLCP